MDPLVIENLAKRYVTRQRGEKKAVWAVKDLTISIPHGAIFGFLGPNGAGKTTTIKMMMGLTLPTTGNILILGKSQTSPSARAGIGFLPENPQFPPALTAQEVLAWTGRMMGMEGETLKKRVDALLARVRLNEVRHERIATFSKGMIQRLGIAQATLAKPALLILDEPLSGLDPPGRQMVTEILKEAREEGCTVFFSSHILSDVRALCDEVGLIVGGHLVKKGEIEAVFNLSGDDSPASLDQRFSEIIHTRA